MSKQLLLFSAFIFSLSLTAQNWVPLADIPSGRHHPVTFSLDGKGYSVTGTSLASNYTKDFYEYDPATNIWTTLTNFPGTARSFSIGATYNGFAYIGFGATFTGPLNDLWRFDPNTNQWTQLANCPCAGRRHPAFVAINNKIYAGLGDNLSGNLDDWWMYDIATNVWTQIPDLPGPGRHHPFHFQADGNLFAGLGHAGNTIYKDWYKLDTASNTWTIMSQFPGEARVAGTQFDHQNLGYVLSGDGDNHSFMATGEFWRYYPGSDYWEQLTPHPGTSRWAPGSFVIDDEVYFFGGLNRSIQQFPTDLHKIDISSNSVGLNEKSLTQIIVYPNPVKDRIFIRGIDEKWQYSFVDVSGRVLLNGEISNEQSISVTDLANGVYTLTLMRNGISKSIKVIK